MYDSFYQRAKQDLWLGGNVPYGYKVSKSSMGSTLEPDNDSTHTLKKIFDLYERGYGFRKIASNLNRTSPYNNFKKCRIESIINNSLYFGNLTWGKGTGRRKGRVKNDKPTFSSYKKHLDLVGQDRQDFIYFLKRLKSTIKDPYYFTTPFILKDLLFCDKCGEKLIPKNYGQGKSSVYRCPSFNGNSRSHNIIKASEIENIILDKIVNSHLTEDDISSGYNEYLYKFYNSIDNYNSSIKSISSHIQSIETYLYNIDEMLLAENLTPELRDGLLKYRLHFNESLDSLTNEKEYLTKLSSKTPISLHEFKNEIDIFTSIASSKSHRMLCLLLIDKIEVLNTSNNLTVNISICPKSLTL